MTEARLSLDWELWVVEQLLFTGKHDDLVEVLAQQGVAPDEARAQVARILASPSFARLKARTGEATLAARLQRLGREVRPELTVRDHIDAETLLDEHWAPSRPLKLTAAARSIRAVQQWTLRGLAARFPEATLQVNVDRLAAERAADTERKGAVLALPEFVDRALAAPSDDFYVVSRNGLLANPAFAALWDDLDPLPPFLVPPQPPRGVSLWAGPAGTRTPAHFDPHNVLLVQVEGSKEIALAPPARAQDHALLDGYYLGGDLHETFGDGVITVRLDPGEALFVPVAWFHQVRALAPSLTLSFLCFAWPNHFHWLGPPGSDDAR